VGGGGFEPSYTNQYAYLLKVEAFTVL